MDKTKKKALREQFQTVKPIAGVLTIRNVQRNLVYIKGSVNLDALINKMMFLLNNDGFENNALQKDWNELGKDGFVFEKIVLDKEDDPFIDYKKEVRLKEEHLKQQLGTTSQLY